MKKHFVLTLLLALICAVSTNCRKKNDPAPQPDPETSQESPGPEPPREPPADAPHTGKTLTSIFYKWGEDSEELMQFEYSNDKTKLVRVDRIEDELYTYDDKDRLTRIKTDGGSHWTQYDIAYNAAGEPAHAIMTKIVNNDQVFDRDSLVYTVRNRYVTKIAIWDVKGKKLHRANWEFTYANNNLLKMEYINVANGEKQTTEYVYGNKRSPFLSCRPKFIFEASYTAKRYSINDLTSESFTYLGLRKEGPIANGYNNDGYPVVANQPDGTFENIWNFTY